MHVHSIQLSYFKRFRDLALDFADSETGLARPLIVLVGQNGSGKSTVLQAIAATLGTATRRLHRPRDLDWPGFDLDLAGNAWNFPYEVAIEVGFAPSELEATSKYFRKVPGPAERDGATPPSDAPLVPLKFRSGEVRAPTSEQYFQFRGREYAKQVVKLVEEGYSAFERVGTAFWYTEHRTSTSLTAEVVTPSNSDPNGEGGELTGRDPLRFDENLLRRRLSDLMQFHSRRAREEYELRPGQRDIFEELQRAFTAVFPDRRFDGAVPRADIDDVLSEPWFFLYDGQNQYEISEMSGGERAIFPLLFDFANWQINNSVVLIDEIELHLHPPLQQALIRALPGLGKNNQFIITTHSDWISQVVPPESVYRLEGS